MNYVSTSFDSTHRDALTNLPLCAHAKSQVFSNSHCQSVCLGVAQTIPMIAKQLIFIVPVFEPELCGSGLRCQFIGHPSQPNRIQSDPVEFGLQFPVCLDWPPLGIPPEVAPEVKRLLPLFWIYLSKLVPVLFTGVIPAATDDLYALIQSMISERSIYVVHGQSRQIMAG